MKHDINPVFTTPNKHLGVERILMSRLNLGNPQRIDDNANQLGLSRP